MAVVIMGAAMLAALLVIFAGLIGRRASRNRKGIVLPEDVDALVWREEKGSGMSLETAYSVLDVPRDVDEAMLLTVYLMRVRAFLSLLSLGVS